ncbi:MAG TPA: hypothetical protein V6D19_06430 [Stenomitos sp.]
MNETTLQDLREGDRLTCYGVRWEVCSWSSYQDPNGYAMEEWLLKSTTCKEYYLLRETDSANPDRGSRWYLAEELLHPALIDPTTQRDVLTEIPAQMNARHTPYPTLQALNRTYHFESQTEGCYQSEEEDLNRITWDYWDEPHLWNLALECWENGELHIYSTREVQPQDFSSVQKAADIAPLRAWATPRSAAPAAEPSSPFLTKDVQRLLAWALTILGFFLMISGV